ncbi:MAG: RHS repeat protein [Xanthomonadales bacterium]|nr:RHS repeat protein [Xanthomonadales bacterium]
MESYDYPQPREVRHPDLSFGGGGSIGNPGNTVQVRDAAEKECDERAGNPIVMTTGNKIESTVDFSSAGEMGLYLRRTYNHYWTYPGLFGLHWVSSFDYSLVPQGTSVLWAQRPDGRRIKFLWNAAQQRFNEDKAAPLAFIERHADGSYTHHTEDQTLETYNANGYVQTLTNPHGIGWTFSYSDNYLQTVTHTSGRAVSFTWTNGRLTGVTDPAGKLYLYSYDANAFGAGRHRLATVTLPGSTGQPASPATLIKYHYENAAFPGALTGISYAGVRHSTFSYDTQGRATASQHAGPTGAVAVHGFQYVGTLTTPVNPPPLPPPPGGECDPVLHVCAEPRPAFDPNADPAELARREGIAEAAIAILSQPLALSQVTHTNALGKQTVHTLSDGHITRSDGLASANCTASWTQRQYDAHGYPERFTDANLNVSHSTFNARGQPETLVEAEGTALARTTVFNWDQTHNRPNWIEVQGDQRQSFEYWTDGRLKKQTLRNLSSTGTPNDDRVTEFRYTAHANGMVATEVVDGPLPGTGDAITRTYNTQGDLIETRNSLGHAITYSQFNGRGQPGRIVGVNGEAIEYDYDARGRVRRQRMFHNGVATETTHAYAASGLLESITTPDGVTETHTYDTARRLKTITRNTPDGSVVRTLTYDAAGNITQDESTLAGQLIARSYTDYDELGRVRARRGNDGQNTRFEYDPNGNVERIRRSLGGDTVLDYDPLNRIKTQTDAELGITRFQYDAADRLTQLTDPRNFVARYDYDGFGQLWQYSHPGTGTTTHIWNTAGQRLSTTRADGTTISHAYADPLGRLTTTTYGSGAQALVHSFTWDTGTACGSGKKGRLCRIDDPHQSLELGYDAYGALTLQRATIGASTYQHRYVHDDLGRLRLIEYPGNVLVDYIHTLDQITAVNVSLNGQSRPLVTGTQWYGATVIGAPALIRHIEHGNGGYRDEYFDLDQRLFGMGSDVGHGMGLEFDANGRVEHLTNFADGNWSQGYGYDDMDRLKTVTSNLGNQGFTYDANGNRQSHSQGAASSVYAISAHSNRIASISGALDRSYSYKPTGQVSQIIGALSTTANAPVFDPALATPAQVTASLFANGFESATTPPPSYAFTYDRAHRLSAITGPGLNAHYQIAATGLRVAKTGNGKTTHFVYGLNGQLLYEHDLSNNRRTQHITLNGQPIALIRNNTPYWVHTDHLGRPELLASQTKTVVWRARLTAFNRSVVTDTIGGYHPGFPGQYHDEETGFAYNVPEFAGEARAGACQGAWLWWLSG